MRFYVAVTDNRWFANLARLRPDEVNFWRPSGTGFGALEPGELFLFKLHSPLNVIAGGGFFVRFERLPLWLAWDAFGAKNGAATLEELLVLVSSHRRDPAGRASVETEVGCVILNEPFFLSEGSWIGPPDDWSTNIVTGKRYDSDAEVGRKVWNKVIGVLAEGAECLPQGHVLDPAQPRYGAEYLAKCRLGQGGFKIAVGSAYRWRCAICGEKTKPVLEAAHIKPFSASGPSRTENGLLLRADLHKLFDKGYLTVTSEYRIEVSRRLEEEFENGKDYYPFHGRPLVALPSAGRERPNKEYLDWHNANVYRG